MKLATNNYHVSGHCWKRFSRSEVKGQSHSEAKCTFLRRRHTFLQFGVKADLFTGALRLCRCIDDVVIVTPFAQILHCLRRVWTNYLLLTNIPPSKYAPAHPHLLFSASVLMCIIAIYIALCVDIVRDWTKLPVRMMNFV